MDDLREKVIKGFECCVCKDGHMSDCKNCPYNDEEEGLRCSNAGNMLNDALTLLKAQEPHVMTPEEVEQIEEQGVVWCEYKERNNVPSMIETLVLYGKTFESPDNYILLMEVTDCDDYLKYYRFWNAKPTDKQREAVKWDE